MKYKHIAALALASVAGALYSNAQNISGAGATWNLGNYSFGGASGIAAGTAFTIAEGTIGGQSDAFDGAAVLAVDGTYFGNVTASFDAETANTSAALLSGLSVTGSYTALQTSPVIRTLYTLTNTTGSTLTANVSFLTNVGSDGSTQIRGTSSGDTLFTTADRWVVTNDFANGDPENLHVLWGVNGLAPSSVSSVVFNSAGDQGVRADFNLTFGVGQTLSLLFFNQITADGNLGNAAFLVDPSAFDSLTSDLTTGLSADQVNSIVNWSNVPVAASPVPEPSTYGLIGALALAGVVIRRRLRK